LTDFIARGVIGVNGDNAARVGQFTYLSETGDHWYQWDGAHRATHFATSAAAMAAAETCMGPWFNRPDPGSIEAIITERQAPED
jgi:hypothetical protein